MNRDLRVTKMHGTLNDFVVLDNRRERVEDLPEFGRFVCDRHAALGADGLLVIESSDVADVRMRVINADGSEAEMCGNGIRCVARFLAEAGEGDDLRIETLAGTIETQVLSREPEFVVRQAMARPLLQSRPLPYERARFVSMGNPHVVIFVDDLDANDLVSIAEDLQRSPAFPDGTNVHLAAPGERGAVNVRHWERGVGPTMACGTGAVAVAAAAITDGTAASPVEVRVPGGVLRVEWDGSGPAFLSGPVERVLDGTLHARGLRHALRT